uniref:Uncharacterized protein n=1 Tax=Arundo donax TaxID=35708 RepID=A0A0A8YLX8_ARUDO
MQWSSGIQLKKLLCLNVLP